MTIPRAGVASARGFRRRLLQQGWDPGELERILLVLSGLRQGAQVHHYQNRIDSIFDRFREKAGIQEAGIGHGHRRRCTAAGCDSGAVQRAHLLFDYLWNVKPRRFGAAYLLSEVVDNHLSPDPRRRVGNCIGLTSLFAVLAIRAGLEVRLLVGDDHLLCRLKTPHGSVDIDPTDPEGFDTGWRGRSYLEREIGLLVASVLNTRALSHAAADRPRPALLDYNTALQLDSGYANAYNNRANLYRQLGWLRRAEADYTRALWCRSDFQEAFCNRGMVREMLGDLPGAAADYQRAARLDPEDPLARSLWGRFHRPPGD